jgi:hypothetical protein
MWKQYPVLVRYRTKSGCNAKSVTVLADSMEHALIWAEAKVRRMRGVIRIDGCHTVNVNKESES